LDPHHVTAPADDDLHQQQMQILQQPSDTATPINSSNSVTATKLVYTHHVQTTLTNAEEMSFSSFSSEPQDGVTTPPADPELPIYDEFDIFAATDDNEALSPTPPFDQRTPQDLSDSSTSLEMINISELDPPEKDHTHPTLMQSGDQSISMDDPSS
jgi:hypothetical protein